MRRKADDWQVPDAVHVFQTDYPRFKALWKEYETQTLTSQVERLYYFPFALRSGDVKPLSGPLAGLRGKYYSQVRDEVVYVVGEQRRISNLFEEHSKYLVPVIEYEEATTEQIHEVFSLYNKQGKHLNAEEIRNALYHSLILMKALLITAGDSDDVATVAPFLAPHWVGLSSTPRVLNEYGFGKAGYKRTKLLSWVAAILLHEDTRIATRSTASHINEFLKRVENDKRDPLRDEETVTEVMRMLDKGLDAHAGTRCPCGDRPRCVEPEVQERAEPESVAGAPARLGSRRALGRLCGARR